VSETVSEPMGAANSRSWLPSAARGSVSEPMNTAQPATAAPGAGEVAS
jgi:hypothetical protein